MSITTKLGDNGQTGLMGGERVSKADLRVEAYGTVDELNSVLGFARSICEDTDIRTKTEEIQKTLFLVGSALSTPAESRVKTTSVEAGDLERITEWVHELEARPGVLADWSLPGAHTIGAAYDVGRAVCRRAERCAVRLVESGVDTGQYALPYLNRLSDLLWLFGRVVELEAGIDSKLRDEAHGGSRWSRAW